MRHLKEPEADFRCYTLRMCSESHMPVSSLESVEQVKKYIKHNLDQALTRQQLAQLAGFSISHFHRVFTAHAGESAISYVRRQRMLRAGRMLRMGAVDITAVALAVGYKSHTAFGQAFKDVFAHTPQAFREMSCKRATLLLREANKV